MLALGQCLHGKLVLRATPLRLTTLGCRTIHSTASSWQQRQDGGAGGPGGGKAKNIRQGPSPKRFQFGKRVGRGFIHPRAPRRLEVVRSNPAYKECGNFIDEIEHSMYCDAQREEDDDGFFFDGTAAPNEHMAQEEDPFGQGFLTEDEMEFPADYKPQPYIPGYVEDQIHFLYKERKWSIKQLCSKFQISSERVCAILMLKEMEPTEIAKGMYDTKNDEMLTKLYHNATMFKKFNKDNWRADYDMGINVQFLQDDQVPDEAYPVLRKSGHVLKFKHRVDRVDRAPPPAPPSQRTHQGKFVVTDVSRGPGRRIVGRSKSVVVADYDGQRRALTNMEAMRRPNAIRRYTLEQRKGSAASHFMPFRDEDADKPVSFSLRR